MLGRYDVILKLCFIVKFCQVIQIVLNTGKTGIQWRVVVFFVLFTETFFKIELFLDVRVHVTPNPAFRKFPIGVL